MKIATRIRTVAAALALLTMTATLSLAQPTFINKIPIPPLIDASDDTVHLEIRTTAHKFNPADPADSLNGGINQPDGIVTYAYNVRGDSTMTILGPTLKWHALEQTTITVKNLIGVPTTTHWHGAEVPASMDGGPHQGIEPNTTWTVSFPVLDSACTMWYHPHYHNTTVEHVQKGLSGMIIVEHDNDQIGSTLPRTYGVDDIPVIMGDIGWTSTSNATAGMVIDTAKGKRPINLVNGVTNPYVEVPAHLIRLRLLNGSTRKGMLFGITDSVDNPFPNLKDFYLIATDGGYTMTPSTMTSLLNGPGARDEIVIDLSGYSVGDTLYLANLNDSLPNSVVGSPVAAPNGGGQDATVGNAFLQLRIVADDTFPGYAPVTSFTPFTNSWNSNLADTSNVARHRLKRLVMLKDTVSRNPLKIENAFTIDSASFDMHMIDDTVCVNTKEIWAIKNETTVAHPFHIHKIQFRVLDITDADGAQVDLEEQGLNGPKDDVLVFPGWTMRFLAQFDDYPSDIDPMNAYMYHCHILTHEDSIGGGMMRQFVVTDQGDCEVSSVPDVEGDRHAMLLIADKEDGTLSLKGGSEQASTVTLIDLQGNRVRTEQLAPFEGEATIRIGTLPSGLYMVEWRTHDRVALGKVAITK